MSVNIYDKSKGELVRIAGKGKDGSSTADKVSYDNSSSKLSSTNVQGAIDEVNSHMKTGINDVKAQLTSGEHEFRFGVTADGEYGYHKEVEGADTVVPFNKPTLLWEQEPSNIGSGSISQDNFAKYDTLIVVTTFPNNSNNYYIGLECNTNSGICYKDGGAVGFRVFSRSSDGKTISFEQAYYFTGEWYGHTDYFIPYKVYGIKHFNE